MCWKAEMISDVSDQWLPKLRVISDVFPKVWFLKFLLKHLQIKLSEAALYDANTSYIPALLDEYLMKASFRYYDISHSPLQFNIYLIQASNMRLSCAL